MTDERKRDITPILTAWMDSWPPPRPWPQPQRLSRHLVIATIEVPTNAAPPRSEEIHDALAAAGLFVVRADVEEIRQEETA